MSLDWIEWPIVIKLNPNVVTCNGVEIPYMVLAQIINELTHPNPRKWIRLERLGECIHVSTRISEEEPNGTHISSVGNGAENDGGERAQAAHP